MNVCIRCEEAEVPEALGYCAQCAVQMRVEFTHGFRLLRQYLASWAAFDEWLRARGAGPAAA